MSYLLPEDAPILRAMWESTGRYPNPVLMKMCGLMLKDGATISELARAMNIHRGTLRDRLIRWGEYKAIASCAHSIDTNRYRYKKVHYVSCKKCRYITKEL